MNQSNKALRELVVKMAGLLEDCHQELTKADESHWNGTSDSGGHNEAWEAKTKTAHTLITLVTNHIKAKMPEKKSVVYLNTDTGKVEKSTEKSDLWNHGYNQALDEVSQLLNELGEAK